MIQNQNLKRKPPKKILRQIKPKDKQTWKGGNYKPNIKVFAFYLLDIYWMKNLLYFPLLAI